MRGTIRILHLWADRADAEKLVFELAATGLDFQAKLVRTHHDYVSALASLKFDLILADDRAQLAGPGELTLFEIAEEISPRIPFVLLCGSRSSIPDAEERFGHNRLGRDELDGLAAAIRKALRLS